MHAVRHSFEISTDLAAPPSEVWAHATSVAGIRDELSPFVRMTFPRHVRALTEDTVPIGSRLCRSVLLLFGLLPIEFDDVCIVDLEPGYRFLEESSMATLRVWRHERTIDTLPQAGMSRVTDRLGWVPRVAGAGAIAAWAVPALFAHRHRRLEARFGAASSG